MSFFFIWFSSLSFFAPHRRTKNSRGRSLCHGRLFPWKIRRYPGTPAHLYQLKLDHRRSSDSCIGEKNSCAASPTFSGLPQWPPHGADFKLLHIQQRVLLRILTGFPHSALCPWQTTEHDAAYSVGEVNITPPLFPCQVPLQEFFLQTMGRCDRIAADKFIEDRQNGMEQIQRYQAAVDGQKKPPVSLRASPLRRHRHTRRPISRNTFSRSLTAGLLGDARTRR